MAQTPAIESARVQCEQCIQQVQMLTLHEAAAFARTDLKTVKALMEFGKLHWMETAAGLPLICLNSLINNEPGGETQWSSIHGHLNFPGVIPFLLAAGSTDASDWHMSVRTR